MFFGFKPDIYDVSVTGHIYNDLVVRKVKRVITKIIKEHKNCKIGATGDFRIRVDQDDYRNPRYSVMYLVYKSTSFDYVADFEVHFINLFLGKTDNISRTRVSKLSSYNGVYYLYVVAS